VGVTWGSGSRDACSRIGKLREARVDRGLRVLFAFDSNQNAVTLVGGDKAGNWNRWHPPMVRLATRLLLDHERSIGNEPRCLSQREARRTSRQISPMTKSRVEIYKRASERAPWRLGGRSWKSHPRIRARAAMLSSDPAGASRAEASIASVDAGRSGTRTRHGQRRVLGSRTHATRRAGGRISSRARLWVV
jgi:hypothetical protein